MLFALGLGDAVVGVTHECDYPPEAAGRPHLTRTVIPPGLAAADVDRAVRERTGRGEPLYELDAGRLCSLEPDLIVTQAVCDVCAVAVDDVRAAAAGERLDRVAAAVAGARRPRVAALEWLDPPFVGGHWVPEMIDLAGGEGVLGRPGARSRVADPGEVAAARPEVVVVMPCGYDTARSAEEARGHGGLLGRLGAERTVAVDAAAYFSRPGPRLVDGVELLGHILHADRLGGAPAGRAIELDSERAEALPGELPGIA